MQEQVNQTKKLTIEKNTKSNMNLNTTKNKIHIGKYLEKNIIDIQTSFNHKGCLEVILFWKQLWWFKGRTRIDIHTFTDIIEGKLH